MSSFKTGTGFSIELEGYYLEARGTHEGLPLYEALGGLVTAIAVVDEPAIGVGTIGNDKERTLSGPVMIPDLKIFRTTGLNGQENCYWYFSAESIKKYQESFIGKMKIGH
ncbi:MAG: hypothetical protein IPP39_07455 [Chitinophagaceae bacterium]|nr:hypothetical protein [Chitinophagaceae bacterium]